MGGHTHKFKKRGGGTFDIVSPTLQNVGGTCPPVSPPNDAHGHGPCQKKLYTWQSPASVPVNLLCVMCIPSTGDQCSQLIVATLVPSTPICLFFNLVKLQCKQTNCGHRFLHRLCQQNPHHWWSIDGIIKETWIAKIKEIGCWTEELITFCPFSPVSAWSKKLPNFAVKHVDLSWDFGHDVPCMGWRIDAGP